MSSIIPLHTSLMALAGKAEPVRLFTTFGMYDGLLTYNRITGVATLAPYTKQSVGLNLGGTRGSGPSDPTYVHGDAPSLDVTPEAIQGVTSITTPQVHGW